MAPPPPFFPSFPTIAEENTKCLMSRKSLCLVASDLHEHTMQTRCIWKCFAATSVNKSRSFHHFKWLICHPEISGIQQDNKPQRSSWHDSALTCQMHSGQLADGSYNTQARWRSFCTQWRVESEQSPHPPSREFTNLTGVFCSVATSFKTTRKAMSLCHCHADHGVATVLPATVTCYTIR